MNLLTKIPLSKSKNPIDYSGQLLLLGSCFSENIGAKLEYYKFQGLQNPFGILFHPLAIEKLIQKSVHQELITEKDVFNENEQWHSFDAHSCLSNRSKEKIITDINDAVESTSAQVKKASHIIITLGTAWVYRNTSSNQVVANCHKVPQSNFTKELLSVDEVAESLKRIIALVQSVNPSAQFIFTVSPVRHLKDGFVENQLSKSHLISAIHKVLEENIISYFPSYELMMDELRDYRFYAKDMVHPNEVAIDYIWERFIEVWIDDTTAQMRKVDEVQRGLQHRAFNPEGDAHQNFLKSLAQKIALIKQEYPFMDFNI
ncbi:GSCFA domain-containing protein [Maribacter sp. 1_MG-2023]|uniref:GSCFA domain-containing protein n=1 Tax=Maribacter sp. 1_MG-2023 TaxID=3062677 RepID=UPI0026E45157|nr:GSCFA domain-containing protein [Maribacter sp. 1_MG-2023]MDO6473588.1 GSCFA domain-containing protein [Maribacter sp. 1_MG-2023]